MKINHIYHGDCIDVMQREIADNVIDMVYADPPYNASGKSLNLVGNKTGGSFYKINEAWDAFSPDEYWRMTDNWIGEVRRVMSAKASFYVSCSMHNISEILLAGKLHGLQLKNIITWYKPNAMPSISKRTFKHSTEYVCWFVAGSGWTFNYAETKKANLQRAKDGSLKQMPDMLEIPIVQGRERVRQANGRAAHPTQKPQRLLEVLITASTNPQDLVLDPFMGSGTTAYVAQQMGRKWIGIEREATYLKMAQERMKVLA
ncbi:MAG: DNA-methyltransferase [Parvibaculales bacterium]